MSPFDGFIEKLRGELVFANRYYTFIIFATEKKKVRNLSAQTTLFLKLPFKSLFLSQLYLSIFFFSNMDQ